MSEDIWKNIQETIQEYGNNSWKPITSTKNENNVVSKFCGQPLLNNKHLLPECGNCKDPMQLFVQLDSRELNEISIGEGILQVFFCTNEDSECDTYEPISQCSCARFLPIDKEYSTLNNSANDSVNFPEKFIEGWSENFDYPRADELEMLGCKLSDDEGQMIWDKGFPLEGDKLAGWPMWIQSIEYPTCPTCSDKMGSIFQIDSEDNVPYMFGDGGIAHIMQCKTHKEHVAISWACY